MKIIPILTILITSCYGTQVIKAFIISRQNNHNWLVSHRTIQLILDYSGMFDTDITQTPPVGENMEDSHSQLEDYDVVVLDYNGDRWTGFPIRNTPHYAKYSLGCQRRDFLPQG